MSLRGRSVLGIESLSDAEIRRLFDLAKEPPSKGCKGNGKNIVILFFEPSTRTRLSFCLAAQSLGISVIDFGGIEQTSLVKGETLVDTFENVVAMGPDLVVVRYGKDDEFSELLSRWEGVPVLSGGCGVFSHPTQALADALTIEEFRGKVQGERVLIMGDIVHSRVAKSNLELLVRLGAEVKFCGPRPWFPRGEEALSRDEGIRWATVIISLRVQWERHQVRAQSLRGESEEYHREFGLNQKVLEKFDGILMHPGPVNYGVELDVSLKSDPRFRVYDQVRNGVHLRRALLSGVLGLGEL